MGHLDYKAFSQRHRPHIHPIGAELFLTYRLAGTVPIIQRLKGRSAYECNHILGRKGQFWEHENFDGVIRPGKFNSTVRYVVNNPVKAALVDVWKNWRWNYLRNGIEIDC